MDAHGHAHAEHDDAEEDGENGNAAHLAEDPGKARRQGHPDDEEDDGDDAEIFTDKGTDFFHDEYLCLKQYVYKSKKRNLLPRWGFSAIPKRPGQGKRLVERLIIS